MKSIAKKLLRIVGIVDSLVIFAFAILYFIGKYNFIKLLPAVLAILCIVAIFGKKLD